jgi:hypothetical protein
MENNKEISLKEFYKLKEKSKCLNCKYISINEWRCSTGDFIGFEYGDTCKHSNNIMKNNNFSIPFWKRRDYYESIKKFNFGHKCKFFIESEYYLDKNNRYINKKDNTYCYIKNITLELKIFLITFLLVLLCFIGFC